MRKLTYVALFLTIGMMFSCQKDPMSEINDGDWNKERNIIGITFADQVGTATITRDGNNAEINFTYNTVPVPILVLSKFRNWKFLMEPVLRSTWAMH